MIYNLFGFADVRIFPLFLVMMSLWRHFLSHGLQIYIFCGTLNELSACQVSILQVVIGNFYRQIQKNTMMGSSWRHFMLLGFENLKFLETLYRLLSLQVSNFFWLSGSNFMEVSVRYHIFPLFLVMTSLWRHLLLLSFQICLFCRT